MSPRVGIDEILFNLAPGEMRAALLSEGRLVELMIEREGAGPRLGNVYLGRVAKLAPSMAAAFVELGAGRPGFLARDDARDARGAAGTVTRQGLPEDAPIARLVSEGEAVLLQVTKEAVAQKGPRLSTRIALAGHWLVLTHGRPGLAVSRRIEAGAERARLEAALAPHLAPDEGVILRTAAEGVAPLALLEDLTTLRALWQDILARAAAARAPALLHAEADAVERVLRDHAGPALRRVACDRREARAAIAAFFARHGGGEAVELVLHLGPEPLFEHHEVEAQLARALEREVPLPSGGSLTIDSVEALTAIDVNTARHAGGGRQEDAILAVNLEAAAEVARQVRLRSLAGIIVVDFVHMESAEHRARVADALRAAFAGDPVATQLGGYTGCGLFELTRRRLRDSLRDQLTEPCAACHGAGRLGSALTVAYEALRAAERAAAAAPGRPLSLRAEPAVVAALEGEALPARRALEARLGRPLALSAALDFAREQFDIVGA